MDSTRTAGTRVPHAAHLAGTVVVLDQHGPPDALSTASTCTRSLFVSNSARFLLFLPATEATTFAVPIFDAAGVDIVQSAVEEQLTPVAADLPKTKAVFPAPIANPLLPRSRLSADHRALSRFNGIDSGIRVLVNVFRRSRGYTPGVTTRTSVVPVVPGGAVTTISLNELLTIVEGVVPNRTSASRSSEPTIVTPVPSHCRALLRRDLLERRRLTVGEEAGFDFPADVFFEPHPGEAFARGGSRL